jgi:hypothetical protein
MAISPSFTVPRQSLGEGAQVKRLSIMGCWTEYFWICLVQ